ncbi:MAG: UPF0175 family protein [Promethearchaeota archaeon]
MEKSTLLRYLISNSIDHLKLKTALEQFTRGKVSLGKAADMAGMNLWEFIDICHENQVGQDFTEEDVDKAIARVAKLDVEKYKREMKGRAK